MIPSKLYDALKWVALLVMPALATFILGASVAVKWEDGTKVATVVTLLSAFLGTILQISNEKFKSYMRTDDAFDGYVQPGDRDPDTGIPAMEFTVSRHPLDFLDRKVVRLKVGAPPANPVYRKPLPDAAVDLAVEKHDGPSE
jgi:hypothetical protein